MVVSVSLATECDTTQVQVSGNLCHGNISLWCDILLNLETYAYVCNFLMFMYLLVYRIYFMFVLFGLNLYCFEFVGSDCNAVQTVKSPPTIST